MPVGVYERTKYHRKINSESHKGIYPSKETKQKISEAEIGKDIPLEIRQRISKTLIGGKHSLKRKRNQSRSAEKRFVRMTKEERVVYMLPAMKANRERWAQMTKEEQMKFLEPWIKAGIKASQEANPSSIEKMIWKVLDELGIRYETQVSFNGNLFFVDIYVSAWRLIIECNGIYYHNYKIFPQKKIRDEALVKYASRNNYRLIWLWQNDIEKNPKSAFVKAIMGIKE